jgi:hypothetical protein
MVLGLLKEPYVSSKATYLQVMLALNGVRAEVNLALIRSLKSLHVENNIKWPDKI